MKQDITFSELFNWVLKFDFPSFASFLLNFLFKLGVNYAASKINNFAINTEPILNNTAARKAVPWV